MEREQSKSRKVDKMPFRFLKTGPFGLYVTVKFSLVEVWSFKLFQASPAVVCGALCVT